MTEAGIGKTQNDWPGHGRENRVPKSQLLVYPVEPPFVLMLPADWETGWDPPYAVLAQSSIDHTLLSLCYCMADWEIDWNPSYAEFAQSSFDHRS